MLVLNMPKLLSRGGQLNDPKIFALTGTVQYDLWQNVISRLEVRWDHSANGANQFGGSSRSPALLRP